MGDLHKLLVTGRLTRDPDSKVTPSGKNVLSCRIAVNVWQKNGSKGEEVPYFYRFELWDQAATTWQDKIHKGDKLFVEGELNTREYTAKDGSTKTEAELKFARLLPLNYNRTSSPTAEPEAEAEGAEDCPF